MDLLLEESTTEKIPILLEQICNEILNHNNSSDSLQKDLFFMLIVLIMIENGFVPLSCDSVEWNHLKTIKIEQLLQWKKSTGSYEALFILRGFGNIPIKLIMCPLGSTSLINTFIDYVTSYVYTVCIPTSRYVVSPQASTIPMIFRDLKHLSGTLKNKITAPVKSIILNYNGYSSASLVGLPEEVFFFILMYLPINDIINVEKSCRRMKALLKNESIWHQLYLRDFKKGTVAEEKDWKDIYKENYIAENKSNPRPFLSAGTLHDLMDISDYVSYIDNPLWDVII